MRAAQAFEAQSQSVGPKARAAGELNREAIGFLFFAPVEPEGAGDFVPEATLSADRVMVEKMAEFVSDDPSQDVARVFRPGLHQFEHSTVDRNAVVSGIGVGVDVRAEVIGQAWAAGHLVRPEFPLPVLQCHIEFAEKRLGIALPSRGLLPFELALSLIHAIVDQLRVSEGKLGRKDRKVVADDQFVVGRVGDR